MLFDLLNFFKPTPSFEKGGDLTDSELRTKNILTILHAISNGDKTIICIMGATYEPVTSFKSTDSGFDEEIEIVQALQTELYQQWPLSAANTEDFNLHVRPAFNVPQLSSPPSQPHPSERI